MYMEGSYSGQVCPTYNRFTVVQIHSSLPTLVEQLATLEQTSIKRNSAMLTMHL